MDKKSIAVAAMYHSLAQIGLPKTKPQRICGYYDPTEKALTGRNDQCPCGSGKKYKKCCLGKGVKS